MIQTSQRLGFTQVRFGVFGAGDQMVVWCLDRDVSLELRVVSQVDAPKTAYANQPLDMVATEPEVVNGETRPRKTREVSFVMTEGLD